MALMIVMGVFCFAAMCVAIFAAYWIDKTESYNDGGMACMIVALVAGIAALGFWVAAADEGYGDKTSASASFSVTVPDESRK